MTDSFTFLPGDDPPSERRAELPSDQERASEQGQAPLVGEMEGRYRSRELLGRGGMGRVTAVDDRVLGRTVALKELLSHGPAAAPAEMVARFLREARVTARLDHPNIVPVHELGRRADGSLYYTMKRVRGRSLTAALHACDDRAQRLALLSHFDDVCQAVAYAHSRGVIHRDLKPDNIMVGAFGETLVVDWGLARVQDEADESSAEGVEDGALSAGMTRVGAIMGTPAYMSPEQARGEPVDPRSDVYSLGMLLLEIATGRRPYRGLGSREILRKLVDVGPPPIVAGGGLPADLSSVIRRATHRDPALRYASPSDLAADVEVWRTGGLVSAYRYSLAQRARRVVAANPRLSALAGMLFVVLTTSLIVFVQLWIRTEFARAEASSAREQTEHALLETRRAKLALEVRALLGAANQERLEGDPSAALALLRAAWSLVEDRPAGLRAAVGAALERAGETGELSRVLSGHASVVEDVAVANGWAVSGGWDGAVIAWDLQTGRVAQRFETGERVHAVALDGGRVWSAVQGGRVRAWSLESGASLADFQAHQPDLRTLRVFGGAVWTAGADGVARWALDAAPICRAVPDTAAWGLAPAPSGEMVAGLDDGRVVALDAACGMRLLARHDGAVHDVAVRGERVASRARTGALWLTELSTGRHLHALDDASGIAWFDVLDIRSDGELIAAAASRGTRTWRASTGTKRSVIRTDPSSLAFSPTDRLAVGGASGRADVVIWEQDARHIQVELSGHAGGVRDLVWFDGGRSLISASDDGDLRVWETPGGAHESSMRCSDDRVTSLSFAPDGARLAMRNESGSACVARFDGIAQPGGVWGRAFEGGDGLSSAVFSPDSALLAVPVAHQVFVMDVARQGLVLMVEPEDDSGSTDVAFSADGGTLAIAAGRNVGLWDVTAPLEICSGPGDCPRAPRIAALEGHTSTVTAVKWRPDGSALLAQGLDARLWDVDARTSRAIGGRVTASAISERGVAIGGEDGEVRLLTAGGGEQVLDPPHRERVTALAFSPAGDRLLSGSTDRFVRLRDLDTGAAIALDGHTAPIVEVAFTPDGETAWTVDSGGEVRVWRVATGDLFSVFSRGGSALSRVAVSPSADRVALAGRGPEVTFWSLGAYDPQAVSDEVGARTNLRVCRASHEVVAVLPYPEDRSIWAPEADCP